MGTTGAGGDPTLRLDQLVEDLVNLRADAQRCSPAAPACLVGKKLGVERQVIRKIHVRVFIDQDGL